MLSRILVAMDDSEMAEHALRYALDAHPDAEITVLHVADGPAPMWGKATRLALADDVQQVAAEYAQDVLNRAHEVA